MNEHDFEPVRGLPGDLPPGEVIVWQGAPDWRVFARGALFTRWIAAYFAALVALAVAGGSVTAALLTAGAGLAGLGLLALFALLVARTTVYTLTNKRVVLRVGIALDKCINLPLAVIGSADLRPLGGGFGEIALAPTVPHRLGYAVLWPHVRPWRLRRPEPMLRAVPDAAALAALLAEQVAAVRAIELAPAPGKAPAAARNPRFAAPLHGAAA